jgi:hypothetical protein
MEDKEKQIEEMTKDLYGEIDYDVNYYSDDNYSEVNFNYIETAKNIVAKGWVKPNKDSVVLSKEEYDDYLNLKDLLDKGYFTSENRVAIHKARKETAEKFAKKIQDYLNDKVCEEFGDNACDVTYFTIDVDKVISDVFEIAEQYGV